MKETLKIFVRKYFYRLKNIFFGTYKNKEYWENFSNHFIHDCIVVFDTETTGLDTENDDIIQIAAVEIVKGEIGREMMLYFATDKSLSPTQKVHNISNETLQSKSVDKKEGLTEFLDFIQNDPMLAHNIKYDIAILNSNLKREGLDTIFRNKFFCTLYLSRQLYALDSYKLNDILDALAIEGKNSHDALDDTKATVNLAFRINESIRGKL